MEQNDEKAFDIIALLLIRAMQMDWQALDAGYEPDEEDQVRLEEVLGVNMVQAEETDGSLTEPVS